MVNQYIYLIEVLETYKNDIDTKKLKLHLQLLPDAINSVNLNGVPIKEVTQISTICDVFNTQPTLKSFITEIHKLIKDTKNFRYGVIGLD